MAIGLGLSDYNFKAKQRKNSCLAVWEASNSKSFMDFSQTQLQRKYPAESTGIINKIIRHCHGIESQKEQIVDYQPFLWEIKKPVKCIMLSTSLTAMQILSQKVIQKHFNFDQILQLYLSAMEKQSAYDLVYEPVKPETGRKCGCYVINPDLLKERRNHFILFPLKYSDYHLEIVNAICNVSLTQHYFNPTNKFLEVEYHFPINHNACVYRFTAEFGKVRIEGVVKEKQEAKKEYKGAVQAGKKAAYGQIDPQNKEILTLKVGNIAPQEQVRIQISYLQELTLSCNTFYELQMMGTISPRYLKYIPVEHVKAGLRNQNSRVKGLFFWNFRITLKTTRKVVFFDSNTHHISPLNQNDSSTLLELVVTNESVLNKDFIFRYTTEDYQLPSCVLGRTDAGSTAMVSFIPKFCDLSLDDAYKASVAGKGFEVDIENAKGEYIFLLDRSGSMSGNRMRKAKEALTLFIKSLPEDSFFNVASFGSNSSEMFPNSVKYSDHSINKAIKDIQKMSANMGGTYIYRPLQKFIIQQPIKGYPKQIFLLTDGGASDTDEVIKLVGVHNKYSRVHTIGIGNGACKSIILGCAEKGKGYHVFIGDEQDPAQKIIQLLCDSLSPVISKVNVKFDPKVVESIIPNPNSMPLILKNQLVNFYITFKGQLEASLTFSFCYEDSLNKMPYASEIVIDPAVESQPFIDRMGYFKKIRLLEESLKDNGNLQEKMYFVKTFDKRTTIIAQSVQHQILSEFTAFICVQKELADGQYHEVKDKGRIKVAIKHPVPGYNLEMERGQVIELSLQKSSRLSNCLKKQKLQAKQQTGGFFSKIKSFFTPNRTQQTFNPANLEKQSRQSFEAGKPFQQIKLDSAQFKMNKTYLDDKIRNMCDEYDDDLYEVDDMIKELEYEVLKEKKTKIIGGNCQSKKFDIEQMLESLSCSCSDIKEKQLVTKLPSDQKGVQVKELVSLQAADGSWNDPNLIGRLYSEDVQEELGKDHLKVVITFLIAKWIDKHHHGSQYRLVARKGLNFARNNSQGLSHLQKLYGKYLK